MSRSRMVWIMAVVALGISAPGAQGKTLKIKGTERGAVITAQGNTTLFAALGSDQRGGYAARQTSITSPSGTTVNFTSKFTDYYLAGTERGTITGTAIQQPDGTFTLSGSGKITGGTGRYRKAHGTITFTGTQATDGRYTVNFTGTLTY
jgi:hypothetical protein